MPPMPRFNPFYPEAFPGEFDHTHTPNGNVIYLSQTQDAAGDHCPDCGRSVYTDTQPHNHKLSCPSYRPHPGSVAAQARP